MLEKIKTCWMILTKKHYAVFVYDQSKEGHTNADWYMDDDAAKDKCFLNAISNFTKSMAE